MSLWVVIKQTMLPFKLPVRAKCPESGQLEASCEMRLNGNIQPGLECLDSKERRIFIHQTCHRINPAVEHLQIYSLVKSSFLDPGSCLVPQTLTEALESNPRDTELAKPGSPL